MNYRTNTYKGVNLYSLVKYYLFLVVACLQCPNTLHAQDNDQVNDNGYWWLFKTTDSIPSINLQETFSYIQKHQLKAKARVVISILDTDIDTNHEALKNLIWKNPIEILDNNIDEDKNGYIDDENGWNFIANKSDGRSLDFYINGRNQNTSRILKRRVGSSI